MLTSKRKKTGRPFEALSFTMRFKKALLKILHSMFICIFQCDVKIAFLSAIVEGNL